MIATATFTETGNRVMSRLRQLSGAQRVWLLNLGIGSLATSLFVLFVMPMQARRSHRAMPWLALAALFYAAEILVVHFQFRREIHTFSLSEIPFVLGLLFATPVEFVLANVIGAALALVIHRRQAPIKLAFNVAQFALARGRRRDRLQPRPRRRNDDRRR